MKVREIIYRGNFTRQEDQWQKTHSFSTSGRPLSSSTGCDRPKDFIISTITQIA